MRSCTSCGKRKEEDEFFDEGMNLRKWCSSCRAKSKAAMRQRKLNLITKEVPPGTKLCYVCNVVRDISLFQGKTKEVKSCQHCRGIHERAHKRQPKYGLSPEQQQNLLVTQNHTCAICKVPFETGKHTHIDHDHSTGKARGILCQACNKGLGFFRDNPVYLLAAVDYLEEHGITLPD